MQNYLAILTLPENLDKEEFEGLFYVLDSEGFEVKDSSIEVYFNEKQKEDILAFLEDTVQNFKTTFSISELENKNWNEQWESNFQPVIIEDFVAVRATFHAAMPNVQHEIIIDPKMSFGTGHHSTTMQMLQNMRLIPFQNKTVLDLGSGTGVLAILAEKLGASSVLAVDNDEWCFRNAEENCKLNNCTKIQNVLGDINSVSEYTFDIILANIHRNFLVENMTVLTGLLSPNGFLFCSGFYDSDAKHILDAALECNLKTHYLTTHNQWDCIIFGKK